MKKLLIILTIVLIASSGYSQNKNVVSAFNFHRDGRLDRAKQAIDAAIVHPQTINQPKTWLYKGTIYFAIARSQNPAYKNLHENPLQVAYEAYMKSLSIDPNYVQPAANPASAKLGLIAISEQFYNKGVAAFNNRDFALALKEFEKTREINSSFGIKDSIATFNAAVAAVQIQDYDKAILLYRELINMNYSNPEIFSTLAEIHNKRKEYDKAATVIKGGKFRFPDFLGLIIAETNLYLATDQIEKAQDLLRKAVEKDPNNYLLHHAIGSNYSQLIEKQTNDSIRKILFTQAEEAYKKAIELKPDYFDAYYNLGALYYEEGRRIYEAAENITDPRLYAKEQEKFNKYWKEALPFLEKAHEIDETDFNTMVSLRTLYARFNMRDKHQLIHEKIQKTQK